MKAIFTNKNIGIKWLNCLKDVFFSQVKVDMNPSERSKMVLFAKARILHFLSQLLQLLRALKHATAPLNSR